MYAKMSFTIHAENKHFLYYKEKKNKQKKRKKKTKKVSTEFI